MVHISAISNAGTGGEMLRVLIDAGAPVDHATDGDYEGHEKRVTRTPLHWYAHSCDASAMKELLAAGANPSARTEEGETALDIVSGIGERAGAEMPGCGLAASLLRAAMDGKDEV